MGHGEAERDGDKAALECGRFCLLSTFQDLSPSRMLSAQTATLAATTLVAVALAFYLLSKSSPEDVPATAAPPESVPAVKQAPIATAPPEAARMKSMSYAPRIAAAPTEPPARNGQAAAGKPAVTRKKKSEGEEEGGGGGKRRSKAAAEAKAAADAKAAEAEESKGEPFVNSIISRAILKQPVDLLALANPPAKESKPKPDGKGGKGDKGERKKSKAKPISSWGESFQVAMQTLEGSAVDAALRAQQQLTGCLVQVIVVVVVAVVVAARRLPRAGAPPSTSPNPSPDPDPNPNPKPSRAWHASFASCYLVITPAGEQARCPHRRVGHHAAGPGLRLRLDGAARQGGGGLLQGALRATLPSHHPCRAEAYSTHAST